jgi:thiamine-monophosphate kinase
VTPRLDEAGLIQRWFARPAGRGPGVVLGIGDDGAVLRPPPGRDLVVATDALCEGTHFLPGMPARALGHRVLAVNLSDLAAMGAEPRWATLVLSLPRAERRWVRDFSGGFFALARRTGIALVGGDTVRGPLLATVTVVGTVRPGEAIPRSGARAGDDIWVTGHPGDAVAGRLAPRSRRPGAAGLRRRFLYPQPRLAAGRSLVGLATSMIDVSDGLADDLRKLLLASRRGALLDLAALPVSAAARRVRGADAAVAGALTGGDDYELLFTVPSARRDELLRRARQWDCAVTCIGRVTARGGPRWQQAGRSFDVPPDTFRHF